MNPPMTLLGQEAHRVQQRQVDLAADYRDVVCNRVLSGGGDRDRPFSGFDGAVRPARSDQSPDLASHLIA